MFGEYKKALKRHSHQSGYDWIAVHQEGLASVNPMKARAFLRHCKVPMMDEWFKSQENKLEGDNDILPFPFNDAFEAVMDLLEF
jgi:hypothetical protein